ncbi:uncharacterized protein EHS24_009453 [Apiotrichum porosum]|uniref:Uncharacterized protein n=1 Tax=Apiotrichum porosum TaxID=105984 RepID=A0A427XLV0_9TREE|nr:uncharacterized protein EHS24_009453 [Apiotrichum porosum]RSH79793.1 hypothetical protein EHS24_009453 [Apiotrichum porosum]
MPDDRHSIQSRISAIEDRLHEQGGTIGEIKGDVSSIKGNMGAMNLRLETVAQTADAAAASSAEIRHNLGTALTALTRVQSLIGDPSADDNLTGHAGPATVNLNRAGAAAVNSAANVNRGGGFPDSGATAEEDVIVDPKTPARHTSKVGACTPWAPVFPSSRALPGATIVAAALTVLFVAVTPTTPSSSHRASSAHGLCVQTQMLKPFDFFFLARPAVRAARLGFLAKVDQHETDVQAREDYLELREAALQNRETMVETQATKSTWPCAANNNDVTLSTVHSLTSIITSSFITSSIITSSIVTSSIIPSTHHHVHPCLLDRLPPQLPTPCTPYHMVWADSHVNDADQPERL